MHFNRKHSLISLAVATSLFVTACGESTSSSAGDGFNSQPDNETSFNEQALLTNLADNIITPTFSEFETLADSQVTAVVDYCNQQKLFSEGTVTAEQVLAAQTSAQVSWKAAIDVWQQAELMQIGPLLSNEGLLRNKIYSWPIVNSCAVDFDVMFFRDGTVNGSPYDITKRTPSRKGLAALEYLLFNDNLASSCETGAPDGWGNLTDTEKTLARCAFAGEVARDIKTNASQLVVEWQLHAESLKNASAPDSGFINEHDAVNKISDALFYLDTSTKDGKLAGPLGLFANSCGSQACPEDVESSYAEYSIEHIVNNLQGFDKLLTGEEGIGFAEYLIDVGDKETADSMISDIQTAISSAQAYEQSMAATLASDPDTVSATHAEVKKVTDKLKANFINSLALELPKTSAGDND